MDKKIDKSQLVDFLVEARGVEPLSENLFTQLSTRVVYLFKFPLRTADKQADRISSFMIHLRGKA